jgi:hypothetical protein
MIEAYKTNAPLRAAYLRMNGITHAEIWNTDEGYQVALCADEGKGWPESPDFATPGQCAKWAATYCPELRLIG